MTQKVMTQKWRDHSYALTKGADLGNGTPTT